MPPFAFPYPFFSFSQVFRVALKSHSDTQTGSDEEKCLQVQQGHTVIMFLGNSGHVGTQFSMGVVIDLKHLNSFLSCQKNHTLVQGITIPFLSSQKSIVEEKY